MRSDCLEDTKSAMLAQLQRGYEEIFEMQPERYYFSPARVNLIGEHIDYNGGDVLPLAISQGTYAAVGLSPDRDFHLFSENLGSKIDFAPELIGLPARGDWADYVRGQVMELRDCGLVAPALNIYIFGDIPNGAGLSSSASLELLISTIVQDYLGSELSALELARLGQRVENHFIGVQSGLMDQVAIALAEEDHALLFRSSDLSYRHCPVDFQEGRLLVLDSRKRRELRESKYNERLSESKQIEEALRAAGLIEVPEGERLTATSLAQFPEERLEEAFAVLAAYEEAEILTRRFRHIVTEQARVHAMVDSLATGDLERAGEILAASHHSLAQDYEVTGPELDALAAACNEAPEIYGARMCGAGFGGVVIALARPEFNIETAERIAERTVAVSGLRPVVYDIASVGGPSRIA